MHRFVLAISGLLVALLTAPASARAGDLEDFDEARAAYESGDYTAARLLLEAMVGGVVPTLQSQALVLESRKYLAATYLFLDNSEDAERQFALLLEAEPTYVLDPASFPQAVLDLFTGLQARREEQRRRASDLAERQARETNEAEIARLIAERERLDQLIELAETEVIIRENSRWIAAIPFGVGQLQNERARLGYFFLVSEVITLAMSIGSYYAHEHWASKDTTVTEGDTSTAERDAVQNAQAWRITNWISTFSFVGLALGGILEAEINFRPELRRTRRRELAPELAQPVRGPELSLRLGPMGGSLRLNF